ncbi:MAG: hypothetical protein IT380_17645 [Myxococcales bacterium]|nr:hypothetical protein [Myxococcales bacterium]
MRAARSTLLSAVFVLGCGTGAPAPKVSSISPAQGGEGQAVDVVVTGEGFLAAIVTDFRSPSRSTVDGAVTVSLVSEAGDALALEDVVLVDVHTVRARVPATVPRGLYDVKVVDARGAEATLPGGYSVVTPAESVASFTVEPLSSQSPGVPFAVRLLAVDAAGTLVDSFDGTLTLSDDTGTLAPTAPGAFVRGRLLAFVTVARLARGDVVHATDALGHTGASTPFDVVPGPAARLAFAQPAPGVQADVCGGPFRLELVDQLGFAVPAPADEAVALSSLPAGALGFFSEPACTAAVTQVTLGGGARQAEVYARGTLAGPVTVRAVPATFPTVDQVVLVAPGPAASLTFSAPPVPVRAAVCSPPVDLTSEDSFGNAAPPAATTSLTVSVTPASGAALFIDATCTTALGPLVLDSSRATARVYLLAADAGVLRVEALVSDGDGGAPLAPASLDVEVAP